MKFTLAFIRTLLMCCLGAVQFPALAAEAAAENPSWWPAQKVPAKYVVCQRPKNTAEAVLAQSVAGLAARAVNESRSDRMVWIGHHSPMYAEWLRQTVKREGIRYTGEADVWEIVARMHEAGIVKGYVLYSHEDGSLNAATVAAGRLEAVLVERSVGQKAREAGLEKVYDACGETDPAVCFMKNRDELNRDLIVVMNPSLPFNRDLAVAHRTMVTYGVDSAYLEMLAWLSPLSPVVGWNSGGESEHVGPPSEYGHFNTASDFCSNLTFLSAGARQAKTEKAHGIDPRKIDFEAPGSFHAFLMSDGDNMQWTMDAFFGPDYYLHPACKRFPMNWTSCPVNISQMSPATWNEIVRRQVPGSTIAEFSGGYQYADIFGSARADRWELLRRYARLTGEHMRRTGVTVLNLMMRRDIGSEDAIKAYRIYAEEIDGLTGILAIQYNPYHGGKGATYWVKNGEGIEIPVVTARYSMWGKVAHAGFGRPDQIAEWVNADAAAGDNLGWTIVHAWSRYARSGDVISDAGNDDRTAARGVTAVEWCVDRLAPATRVVSLEELLWRIRMKHDPGTTRKIIEKS